MIITCSNVILLAPDGEDGLSAASVLTTVAAVTIPARPCVEIDVVLLNIDHLIPSRLGTTALLASAYVRYGVEGFLGRWTWRLTAGESSIRTVRGWNHRRVEALVLKTRSHARFK